MGLTSSLFAGLSGMKSNEFRMDVIGNNIANVNTYGFKSSRASFQSQFSNTFSFGTAANGSFGGTNPTQVGTGSGVGSVQRDFSAGSPETTGVKTDLSIQGQGLFIVKKSDGSQAYTRDGSFQFNSENYLITADGNFLQGYGVDDNFNINTTLGDIKIPLQEVTTAQATSSAVFDGDLNANGISAIDTETGEANGNVRTILDTFNSGQALTDAAAPNITTGTLLTDLEVDGNLVFDIGNVVSLDDAVKGGQTLSQRTFEIEDGTETLGDFMTWLEGALGIFNGTDYDVPDFTADSSPIDNPGVSISFDAGSSTYGLQVVGNIGSSNALTLGNAAIKIEAGSGTLLGSSLPFNFSTADGFTQADVESMRTSFTAYDSLGTPLNIDITMVMESKNAAGGVTWRYFAESNDNTYENATTDTGRVLGTGTISFDGSGNYLEGSDLQFTIQRTGTGAETPQAITLDFSEMNGFSITDSAMSLLTQDGFQSGTLQDFSIGQDGTIVGSFDNGLTRTLGQVVLGTFRNYAGLISQTDNLYTTGPNSGDCILKRPMELGTGSISPASLELSNVDLSREFINLIVSSTGFSASSRIIQTSDQLLTELMALTR